MARTSTAAIWSSTKRVPLARGEAVAGAVMAAAAADEAGSAAGVAAVVDAAAAGAIAAAATGSSRRSNNLQFVVLPCRGAEFRAPVLFYAWAVRVDSTCSTRPRAKRNLSCEAVSIQIG